MTDPGEATTRRINITTLADFSCRSGDLDSAGVVGPTARDGQRAHQRVQAESSADCEVSLQRSCHRQGEDVTLSGRIDLLDSTRGVIGEIKSTLVPVERLSDSKQQLHLAQLRLYGWLWLGQDDVEASSVTLELIYVNLRNGESTTRRECASAEELDAHAASAIDTWLAWQAGVDARRERLIATAAALDFPHTSYRTGQRTMAVAVFRSLRDRQALIIEAPTGIGKTISSLYPALKSLADDHARQLLYLTAKVSGRRSAQAAVQRLADAGVRLSAITLRSRATACFCERGRCDRQDDGRCPMTLGYHDRLPAARAELLDAGVITDELLDETAWDHQLCPHALLRHLLPWIDIVIGDFNHVFDPLSRLPGSDEPAPDVALLVDEAHNLPSRGRAMHSASLSRLACLEAGTLIGSTWPAIAPAAARVERSLMDVASRCKRAQAGRGSTAMRQGPALECVLDDLPNFVIKAATDLLDSLNEAFVDDAVLPPEFLALHRQLSRFLVVAGLYGDDHCTVLAISHHAGKREVRLQLDCLDARSFLARQHKRFGVSICFSATLAPASVYRDALGLPATTRALSLESPFEATQVFPAVVSWVDTRYRRRAASLDALIELIASASARRAGNYLVCLASHVYLENVCDAFIARYPDVDVWRQRVDDSATVHAENIARLDQRGHRIGFVILGGVYAEGIDYPDERLVGVFIVGTALSPPGTREDLMIANATTRGENGFDRVSRYPGFSRVMQTAGRVIRTERDRGVILLIDDRYAESFYRKLFPTHWQVRWPDDLDQLTASLDAFWSASEDD